MSADLSRKLEGGKFETDTGALLVSRDGLVFSGMCVGLRDFFENVMKALLSIKVHIHVEKNSFARNLR